MRRNKERGNEDRGNKLRRCGAQTPSLHLRGERIREGTGIPKILYPRRRLLGVCAPQRRILIPRSSFPRSSFPTLLILVSLLCLNSHGIRIAQVGTLPV